MSILGVVMSLTREEARVVPTNAISVKANIS